MSPPTIPTPASPAAPQFPDEDNAWLKMLCAGFAKVAAAIRCGALPNNGLATDPAVIASRNLDLAEYRFQYALLEKVFDQQTSTNPDVDFGWQNVAIAGHAAVASAAMSAGILNPASITAFVNGLIALGAPALGQALTPAAVTALQNLASQIPAGPQTAAPGVAPATQVAGS
jgi:hypothetical protein